MASWEVYFGKTKDSPEYQAANLVSKGGHEVWTASTGDPGAQGDGRKQQQHNQPKSEVMSPRAPAEWVGLWVMEARTISN